MPTASDLDILADLDAVEAERTQGVPTSTLANLIGARTAPNIDRDALRAAFERLEASALPDGFTRLPDGRIRGPVAHGLADEWTPEEWTARQQRIADAAADRSERAGRLDAEMGPTLGALVAGAAGSMDATRRMLGTATPDSSSTVERLGQASADLDPSLLGDVTRGVGGLAADLPLMLTGGPLAAGAKELMALTRMRAALAASVGKPVARAVAGALPTAAAVQPLAIREGLNADGGAGNKLAAWLTETATPAAFGRTGVERAIIGGDRAALAGGLRAAAVQVLKDAGLEAGEEAATELTHALHEFATGTDPQALQASTLLRRLAVAGTVGGVAGAGFNLPGAVEQARAPTVEQVQAQALDRAALERALAGLPDDLPVDRRVDDPRATIVDPAQQTPDARAAAVATSAIPTPPSAAGLDPEADAAPLPPDDPLLDMTPTEVGKLARADAFTPATVEAAQAPTEPLEVPRQETDPAIRADRQDFAAYTAERGETPESYQQRVEQTTDMVPQPDDEQGVRVGPSPIQGKGTIVQITAPAGEPLATAFMPTGQRTPAGRYTNHSASPNAELRIMGDRVVIVPQRDLATGDEVTVNYRQAQATMQQFGQQVQQRQSAPRPAAAPAPAAGASDAIARHRKLAGELRRWQDREALARGEGKSGASRASGAKKNADGVRKLLVALEGRMTPAELSQVRPQVQPEAAPAPAAAVQPSPKLAPAPAAAPSPATPRQIDGERPSRASAAQPEAPAEPYSGLVPGAEVEPGRWSVIGTNGTVTGFVRAKSYAEAAAKAATGVTDENAKGERPRPIPAAARLAPEPEASPADRLKTARAEVAALEAEQAQVDIDSPEWAVIDDRLATARSRRDAAEKAADPTGYRIRKLESQATWLRNQLATGTTADRAQFQSQLDRIEATMAEIRDELAAAANPPATKAEPAPADAWTPFPASSGTLGIPRSDMPQVSGDKRGALANFLRARGITWEDAEVAPKDLRPSQAEFNPAKVAAAAKSLAKDGDPARAILVSSDNRIIDGHHQAMAMQKADPDTPVRVIRIGAPAREAIAAINAFPSAEQAAGATPPSNRPAIPDSSTAAPQAPSPQATPLGRLMSAPADPLKLTNLPAEARAQLLADARMLAQVAKSGSKTANRAKHIAKQLEKIAQAEADAQAKAGPPAAASTPTPITEDQPHADRPAPADDRRAGPPAARAERDAAAAGPLEGRGPSSDDGAGRQRVRAEPEAGRQRGDGARPTDRGQDRVRSPDEAGRPAVAVSGLTEAEQARGDTRPSQDERLVALLQRGETVAMQSGDSLSVLVRGYVEDRVPAFSVEGKLVRNEHDAAALFGALRSPYVERLALLVVGADGTVRRSGIYGVGSVVGTDIPTTLADMEAATGTLLPGDTVYWSHNHPSGDPKPSNEDVAVYRRLETIMAQRGAAFRGIVTNGRSYFYFTSGTAMPVPRSYDAPAPYEAVRFDDRMPMIVHGPAKAAELVRLVQTNPDAVVLYILTSRARVQAVQVYAAAPAPELVESEVRAFGGVQAIFATGDAGRANDLARTMHAAPTVQDIILTAGTEPASYRIEARFTPGTAPKIKDATGDTLRASAMDERVNYGAEPRNDDDPADPQPADDAELAETDTAAMRAAAAPLPEPGTVPPAPPASSGGMLTKLADGLNAQPTGALGFLSPLVGTVKLANGAVRWWSEPLVERVERQAGEHGKEVARMARAANDRTRQLLGQASAILTPTLKLMSGRNAASRAAVRNLRSVEWSTDGAYGFARFQDLVENANDLTRLAPAERAMVEKYRALVDLTGQFAENAQFKVFTGQDPNGTPTWLLFQRTPEGRKFIRRATQELHDLMQRPGSPEFEQLASALADANGMTREKVYQRLRDESERSIILRQPLESTRWLDRFPTHIRINGRIVPLLESDPFLAAQHIVRGTAMRVGYVEQFGQDIATAATPSEHPAVKAWVHAGGDPDAFVDLSRSLNGMPVDQSPRLAPGSAEYDLVRSLKATLGIIRTGLLSKAAIVNIPESLGNTLAFVGGKRWLGAWAELMTDPRTAAVETARMGARTQDVANLMMQEGRKRESIERMARDIGLRVTLFQGVNEVNELHAAVAGLIFAKDLAAGRTSSIDADRLRLLGFTDAEVAQLMSRSAAPALLEAVATRMAEATQGSTSLPSERAKSAHNRAWNLLVAFDAYGQMKANRLVRVHRMLADAVRDGKPERVVNAARLAAEFYAGTAASGTAALFLAALAMGGASGLKQLWEQGEEAPADLAVDALRYAMLGGAAASVVNAATAAAEGGDQFAEALTRLSLPVSLVQEVAELANGAGRYRDQDMDERAVTFLRSHLPITRPIATLAAAIGVSYSDPGREAAMSAYWKWRRENTRMVSASGQDEAEDQAHARFRASMRRAVVELRAGRDPSKHLAEAVAAKGEQADLRGKPLSSVVAAIRARRLLATLKDEEHAAVAREIGPTATAKLEAWDQMLTEWAERMKAPAP